MEILKLLRGDLLDIANRTGTNCAKWDETIEKYENPNIIPLTVADMDFKASEAIINSMVKYAEMGIYGYTNPSPKYLDLSQKWMKHQYKYEVDKDCIVFCPRIIQALSLVIQNFTKENDDIMIMTPLYSPIQNAIKVNNRKIVENKLIYENGSFNIDFEDFENNLKSGVKFLVIVSPHNPTGKVLTKDEIERIISLCKKYDVLIFSDEVHADFVWDDNFVSFASFFSQHDKLIVANSPSKTFNIPGLEISNIIIENFEIREKFREILNQAGIHNPNYFSIPAIEAAYGDSYSWMLETKKYIKENMLLIKIFFEEDLKGFKCSDIQGTFLLWISYKGLNITEEELSNQFINQANVAVSLGSEFGDEGEGFFRINAAAPRELILTALDRIKNNIDWESIYEK